MIGEMMIELPSPMYRDERNSEGVFRVIRGYGAEKGYWYAKRSSSDKPWRISFGRGNPAWVQASKMLISFNLVAWLPASVKIQLPEKTLSKGQHVVYGLCFVSQGSETEKEMPWTATTRTGKRWTIRFTSDHPAPWLEGGVTTFIRGVLQAQCN